MSLLFYHLHVFRRDSTHVYRWQLIDVTVEIWHEEQTLVDRRLSPGYKRPELPPHEINSLFFSSHLISSLATEILCLGFPSRGLIYISSHRHWSGPNLRTFSRPLCGKGEGFRSPDHYTRSAMCDIDRCAHGRRRSVRGSWETRTTRRLCSVCCRSSCYVRSRPGSS